MLSNLSKETLSNFLSSIFENESIVQIITESIGENKCIYHSLRGKREQCKNDADTAYGYCKNHVQTVQAKRAKKAWDSLNVQEQESHEQDNSTEQDTEPHEQDNSTEQPQDTESHEQKSPKKSSKRVAKIIYNEWGNYEHPETCIVFNPKSRAAYGVQHRNGDVYSLGPDQVKICIRNGWNYILPEAQCIYDDVSSDSSETESESE